MVKCTLIVILLIFLLGLLFIITNKPRTSIESFANNQCPNILIQKENFVYLYNSKLAVIPGVNPVKFNNLDDYVEFTNWQRSQNIQCPVLFLQHSYDAQGNPLYKTRPSPLEMQGGLQQSPPLDYEASPKSKLFDANHSDPPFNQNSYPGFDPQNQYIGLDTPLDKLFNQGNGVSPSPMDANWGGGEFTQSLIDKGYFKNDNVSIKIE